MSISATNRFVGLAVGVAVLLAATLSGLSLGVDEASLRAVGFFSLLAVAAHLLSYQIPRAADGNISFIPYMAAVAVAPGLTTAVAAGLSVLASEVLKRKPVIRIVFNVSQYAAAVSVGSIVFLLAGGHPMLTDFSSAALPFAAAFLASQLTNSVLVSGVLVVSQGGRLREMWARSFQRAILFDLFTLPVVFGFAYVYVRYGPVWTLLVTLPLYGIRELYKTNYQLERVNEELLQLMVAAIEARDPYTSGHSRRVATYARVVARAAGLPSRAIERVYTAALLHDVGKIHEEFAPILRKPGRLTDAEFAVMKTHSEKGATLVSRVSQFLDLVPAIRGHHEAWNGAGYPDKLAGDLIPQWARVIAIADTIDAMTTDRPYREALSAKAVRTEIERQAGEQFDPKIARALTTPEHWARLEAVLQSEQPASTARTPEALLAIPRHSMEHVRPA